VESMLGVLKSLKIRAQGSIPASSGIWGTSDEAVLNIVEKIEAKGPKAFDFESEVKQFRGFLHWPTFPVFFGRILCQISFLQHIDFTENIYRVLIK
jgi:hypothetical protein